MTAHSQRRGHTEGLLEVECWCRHAIVLVPPSDVRAGRTRSCGRAWCKEPR